MCSHYQAVKARARLARMGIIMPPDWEPGPSGVHVYPTQMAPILRRPRERDAGDEAVPEVEVVDAAFGLLPMFAKTLRDGVRTYNARSETVATKPSFRDAWRRGQHCIIPAEAIYEPDWRTGIHVPTRIEAADGDPLGVAGLWSTWHGPDGQRLESFTMLTINADTHPIFRELHRPDPKRPPELQDKRMVVVLPRGAYIDWLDAPAERSMEFLQQYPADRLLATGEPQS